MQKEDLYKLLKIDVKKDRVDQIQNLMMDQHFWSDQSKATKLSQELAYLNNLISDFEHAESEEDLRKLESETLYDGEFDNLAAIISIHAGAGGTEAQDWAQMLLRMYLRYCEKKGYKTEILEQSDGEEVGVKSATVQVVGPHAYGNLKTEAGVHRLVRISPFDADKARHTSFALIEVIPEFEEVDDVEIDEKDLKIDTFHASGHGGQSVNTTNSAVRITHLPSKIIVSVQNERSQAQNREVALKIIKSKLKQKQLEDQKSKEKALKGEHTSAEWGNQIKSYVLQPYQQVKDHRTSFEHTNPTEVLDGELDEFINSYLKFTHNNQ